MQTSSSHVAADADLQQQHMVAERHGEEQPYCLAFGTWNMANESGTPVSVSLLEGEPELFLGGVCDQGPPQGRFRHWIGKSAHLLKIFLGTCMAPGSVVDSRGGTLILSKKAVSKGCVLFPGYLFWE